MKYLKVSWVHDLDDEPILLYSEIDSKGFEVRKIEIYRDGSFGLASLEKAFGGTQLSYERMPEIDEIRRDTQFLPLEITQFEFEEVWAEYDDFL